MAPDGAAEDLARISEESAGYSALLADWREAEIALSTIEFMSLTDDWFRMPAARLKAVMETRSIQLLQEAIPQAKKCGVDTAAAAAQLRQCEQVTRASATV